MNRSYDSRSLRSSNFFSQPRWEPVRRLTREKNIVLVVSPLINPMKNQGSRLNLRGIRAISFSDVSSELRSEQLKMVNNEWTGVTPALS